MYRISGIVLLVAATILASGCSHRNATAEAHTYALGDRAQVGHIAYTVFETQYLTQIQKEPTPRIPQHRFLLVRLDALNSGGEDVIVPALTLEDDNGNSYPELSNGEGVPQWIGYLRTLKPADTAHGYALFDAPPKHYKMRVMDENSEQSGLIDLPLSFGAEAPQVTLPGPK